MAVNSNSMLNFCNHNQSPPLTLYESELRGYCSHCFVGRSTVWLPSTQAGTSCISRAKHEKLAQFFMANRCACSNSRIFHSAKWNDFSRFGGCVGSVGSEAWQRFPADVRSMLASGSLLCALSVWWNSFANGIFGRPKICVCVLYNSMYGDASHKGSRGHMIPI